jgi:hypothetical protein
MKLNGLVFEMEQQYRASTEPAVHVFGNDLQG